MRYSLGIGMLTLLAACGANPEDLREIRTSQAKILDKLGDLEKKVEQIAARPAAPAAPQRPQLDPTAVYNIPAGNSPFKGPADAPVVLTEFSDFQ